MAVTQEQIFTAAADLVAAGQRPTLAAIRQITGGSYTTIGPALAEWKERQKAASRQRDAAPAAITERLAEVGTEIWALAQELAGSRLAAEREALEAAKTGMAAAQAEAAELADRLATELDEARARIEALTRAETVARAEAEELKRQVAVLTERATAAEVRSTELRAELDRTHQLATDAQAERDQARQEAATLGGRLAASQEQLAALMARIQPMNAPAADK